MLVMSRYSSSSTDVGLGASLMAFCNLMDITSFWRTLTARRSSRLVRFIYTNGESKAWLSSFSFSVVAVGTRLNNSSMKMVDMISSKVGTGIFFLVCPNICAWSNFTADALCPSQIDHNSPHLGSRSLSS